MDSHSCCCFQSLLNYCKRSAVDYRSRVRERFSLRVVLAQLLLISGSTAWSAGGFITGTDIRHGSNIAQITVSFGCKVSYLSHQPTVAGDTLRIQLEATNFCTGISPLIAEQREHFRPAGADEVNLVDIEYDGSAPAGQTLTLNFDKEVRYEIDHKGIDDTLIVRVYMAAALPAPVAAATLPGNNSSSTGSHRVIRNDSAGSTFVINLQSSPEPITRAEIAEVQLGLNQSAYQAESTIDGQTWYRMRFGFFDNVDAADAALRAVVVQYPNAWIDHASDAETQSRVTNVQSARGAAKDVSDSKVAKLEASTEASVAGPSEEKVAALMGDARAAMSAGEVSRAVQIYTKILQLPANTYSAEALEYLALARERNGQLAHAVAEYKRYLAMYPDSEGANRVRQRLTAMMSSSGMPSSDSTLPSANSAFRAPMSAWTVNTYLSQYYRRDANQINENDEVVSQSALYSDINVDARRRGRRFDFSSRVSAGYRYDALDRDTGSGNDIRISYAYADLADADTRLRGRIGRQSRHNGGVLGRFDGLNLSYQVTDSVLLNTVIGKPVNSASSGVDDERTFIGLSANFDSIWEDIDFGTFVIQQEIEGLIDRQAVGAEFRYFANGRSLWGLVDYDTEYQELGSLFLQGSWRFESEMTLNALVDRRRSPFLSAGNAMIGQAVGSFDELEQLFTEDELRQLSLDRSAISTTYTVGFSRPLSPRFHINADVSQAVIEATPESGGVPATEETTYRYFSTSLLASSILKQGDVSVLSIRYSDSNSIRVTSVNLDVRYPLGIGLRINPRLRVEHREIRSDGSTEWIYTPAIRMQYRLGRRGRIEFEAGRQFANRDGGSFAIDRESYFINVGYQVFFQ